MGLAQIFETTIMPIIWDGGKCLFYITLVSGIYAFIRGSASDSIRKIKVSIIGYVLLQFIIELVGLIDKLSATIHF